MKAIFDTLNSEAVIGSLRVPVADAGPHGEVRVGGDGGAVLRPISFGQRTRIVSRAALTQQPVEGIAAGVLQAATVQQGAGETAMLEVMALALAGADQPGAAFAATAQQLARSTGWLFQQIMDAQAVEVDQLAGTFEPSNSGWTTVQFSAASTDELSAVRAEYAENLLRRVGNVQGAGDEAVGPMAAAELQGLPPTAMERTRTIQPTDSPAQGTAHEGPPVTPNPGQGLERLGVTGGVAAATDVESPFAFRVKLSPSPGGAASTKRPVTTPPEAPSDGTSGGKPGLSPRAALRDGEAEAGAGVFENGNAKAMLPSRGPGGARRSGASTGPSLASDVKAGDVRTVGLVVPSRSAWAHAALAPFPLMPGPAAPAPGAGSAFAVEDRTGAWNGRRQGPTRDQALAGTDAEELADRLAVLVNEEADLRGLDR